MANKTIDEIKAEAAVVRDATEEGENTALRVGTVMIDMIDTLSESVSINAIKGYVVIDSTSELPEEPTAREKELGYILNTTLYVFVGRGGDTLEGLYQSVDMKGEDGSQGVGFASVADKTPNPDGTAIITLTNGDTITLDLNHDHAAYPKYELVSSLPASPDSGTLYLIAAT